MQVKIDVQGFLASMMVPELRELRAYIDARLTELARTDTLTFDEIALCHTGQWIQAVKAVRARTGMGLKESKDLVDRWRVDCGGLRPWGSDLQDD